MSALAPHVALSQFSSGGPGSRNQSPHDVRFDLCGRENNVLPKIVPAAEALSVYLVPYVCVPCAQIVLVRVQLTDVVPTQQMHAPKAKIELQTRSVREHIRTSE